MCVVVHRRTRQEDITGSVGSGGPPFGDNFDCGWHDGNGELTLADLEAQLFSGVAEISLLLS